MSKRDLTGAVDFAYLERFALNDAKVIDEVLALFREQAAIWSPMLDAGVDGWRDAVHTLKGAARGVGAVALGDACDHAEAVGAGALPAVHAALDAALFDVAAYVHEQALKSLKGSGPAVLDLDRRVPD
jgi:HPt (histidine-containing phosphotransfer) domain-containing protein